MVLESLPGLLLPLLATAARSAGLMVVATVTAVAVSVWWFRRTRISDGGLLTQAAALPVSNETRSKNGGQDNSEDDVPGPSSGVEMEYERIPYDFQRLPEAEMIMRSADFFELMKKRRTIRKFSTDPVPRVVLEHLLRTAGSSPSGANAQPWTYVVVSDEKMKGEIRRIVELEEEINYERRMGKQWVDDLKPFKLNWEKPYLTEAPHLVLVFKQVHSYDPVTGKKRNHYYQEISVSLSVGILLAAIQNAGLVTLTSTPLNCGPGLRTLLKRPEEEKLVLLLPVGYPAEDATVPKLERKELEDFVVCV